MYTIYPRDSQRYLTYQPTLLKSSLWLTSGNDIQTFQENLMRYSDSFSVQWDTMIAFVYCKINVRHYSLLELTLHINWATEINKLHYIIRKTVICLTDKRDLFFKWWISILVDVNCLPIPFDQLGHSGNVDNQ